MTAAAEKVLHGIVMPEMQKNGQIQNVFYNWIDNQHSPNERILGPSFALLTVTSRVLHASPVKWMEAFLPSAYTFYYF